MNKALKLISAIVICQVVGIVGSLATSPFIPTWYASLQKPSFAPPNWLFAPVWIILFTLMGIALYLVWNKGLDKKSVRIAIIIFAIQLILNSIWSILFFGLQSPFYAFIEIIFLWGAISLSIYYFYKLDRNAGLILLPYIFWVSFAAVLNYFIWILNP